MASRTPPIGMANPFQGSFQLEDNADLDGTVLQYMAVKKGATDELVQPLAAADVARGFNIEGIAQQDALVGEWLGVRYFGTTWAWATNAADIVRDDPIDVIPGATPATNGMVRRILPATLIPAGQMIAGIALENGAAGTLFKVFLTRQVQVLMT